jgi:hypothetical protein
MCNTIAPTLLDAERRPISMRSRDVLAVIWAQNDEQAGAAVEFLRHALWPYYFLFQIREVRQLPRSEQCPLHDGEPPVFASMVRERWAWVLVPPGTDPAAVAS